MMKSIRKLILIAAALLTLTNASVWEGAAAAAPAGDLPDEGYYAATNSFPRNTVVDITNLETGKSIRVIVAAGLETPGLLAVLSRDAAAGIGLQPRFIGRIRMTQPSDPIAFARFTEGLATSGDPDYDPRAMVAADASDNEAAAKAQAVPEELPAAPAKPRSPSVSTTPVPANADENYPYLGYSIVDVPDAYPGPALAADEGVYKDPDLVWVDPNAGNKSDNWDDYWNYPAEKDKSEFSAADDGADSPESTQYPIWAQGGSVGVVDEPEPEPAKVAEVFPPETPAPLYPPAPAPPTAVPSPIDPGAPYGGTGPAGTMPPGPFDLTLIPAEERPPEEYFNYDIPPEAIIGPIGQRPPSQAQMPEDYLGESFFIDPIEKDTPPDVPALTQTVEPPREQAPAFPPELEGPNLDSEFSVPMISELERGKYYLQLCAFSQAALVEDALTKINRAYPLAIQTGGSLYRILIGPVNQGESGALLQRFKRSGYGDAFVKSN